MLIFLGGYVAHILVTGMKMKLHEKAGKWYKQPQSGL